MVMFASLITGAGWIADVRRAAAAGVVGDLRGFGFIRSSREAIVRPSEIAAGPCQGLPRMPRFEVFKMCDLRIDQQARRHGECRALGRFGQAGKTERTADPHRAAENPSRQDRACR